MLNAGDLDSPLTHRQSRMTEFFIFAARKRGEKEEQHRDSVNGESERQTGDEERKGVGESKDEVGNTNLKTRTRKQATHVMTVMGRKGNN